MVELEVYLREALFDRFMSMFSKFIMLIIIGLVIYEMIFLGR